MDQLDLILVMVSAHSPGLECDLTQVGTTHRAAHTKINRVKGRARPRSLEEECLESTNYACGEDSKSSMEGWLQGVPKAGFDF